jgi:uncharacterized protein
MDFTEQVIAQTKNWIVKVVVGCNFCPFAAKEVKNNTIRYKVEPSANPAVCLETLLNECAILDKDESIETTFVIFPNAFKRFGQFLDMADIAEQLLTEQGYEGVYQVASFHPMYVFEGSDATDAANFTNRSIYPMLHLLREASMEKALDKFPHPEEIPDRNIQFAHEKGLAYMQQLRNACM